MAALICERVRRLRSERGLPQEELARLAPVSVDLVKNLLRPLPATNARVPAVPPGDADIDANDIHAGKSTREWGRGDHAVRCRYAPLPGEAETQLARGSHSFLTATDKREVSAGILSQVILKNGMIESGLRYRDGRQLSDGTASTLHSGANRRPSPPCRPPGGNGGGENGGPGRGDSPHGQRPPGPPLSPAPRRAAVPADAHETAGHSRENAPASHDRPSPITPENNRRGVTPGAHYHRQNNRAGRSEAYLDSGSSVSTRHVPTGPDGGHDVLVGPVAGLPGQPEVVGERAHRVRCGVPASHPSADNSYSRIFAVRHSHSSLH